MKSDLKKELVLSSASLVSILSGNPSFVLAAGPSWEIGKQIFETYGQRSQDHQYQVVKEFIGFVASNQELILNEIETNSNVALALALLNREMNKQRFKQKREHLCNILKNFCYTKKEVRDQIELERMYHTMNLISLDPLKLLKETQLDKELSTSPELMKNDPIQVSSVISLFSLGLLMSIPGWDGASGYHFTNFAQQFKKFVFEDHES